MLSAKKLLLGTSAAAAILAGAATTANAHAVAVSTMNCDTYAREYAQTNAFRFGLFGGWRRAYNTAYNQCLAGGPDMVQVTPTAADVVTAPVAAAANVATTAAVAAGTLAGTALSIPGTILGALTSPFVQPAAPRPRVANVEPVVQKNFRGSFEEPVQTVSVTPTAATTSLALAAAPAQGSPEWYTYCAAKYRSFDPATGTYLAFSGERRMCR